RPTGGLATAATFSFYGNKILTCGEGGAITLNDPQLETRVRTLRGQGADPRRQYYFPVTGYNFRLTNLAAALLCGQLERHGEILATRRALFSAYQEQLAGIPGLGFQPVACWAEPAPWLFSITVDEARYGHSRDEVREMLKAHGFETRPFFHPLHHLPPFHEASRSRGEHLPITDRLAASGMNLPTFNGLTFEEIEALSTAIRRFQH
ncbi:MAG TPA: DegT/DnrJ/EryC1/StrS family aminotransferase, partial [Stenomitos sp.]